MQHTKELVTQNISDITKDSDKKGEFCPGFFGALVNKQSSEQAPEEIQEPTAPQEITYTEQQLQESKTQGYESGYAKGYEAAKSEREKLDLEILSALQAIEKQLAGVADKLSCDDILPYDSMVLLSTAIAKKLARASMHLAPELEIEPVIKEVMKIMCDKPNIVIHVNEELMAQIMQKAAFLKEKERFGGEVHVVGDQNIAKGSCKVEWQGGGLTASKEELFAEVEKVCGILSADDE